MVNNISIEAKLATDELAKLKDAGVGSTLPYAILTEIMGTDAQGSKGRGYLNTARRICLSKHDMVIEAEKNIGLKYLGPREVINFGIGGQKRIRRAIRRQVQKLVTIVPGETADLTNEDRLTHNTLLSTYGVLDHVMKPAVKKKIEAAVQTANRTLPVAQTLALFGGRTKAAGEPVN